MGYSPTQKGYKCYHSSSRKFYVPMDVTKDAKAMINQRNIADISCIDPPRHDNHHGNFDQDIFCYLSPFIVVL